MFKSSINQKWMKDYKRFQKNFTSPFKKVQIDFNNIIFSKNSALSMDFNEIKRNLNIATIGAAGSGKNRNFIIPNLLQANGSYIVIDVNGQLYNSTSDFFKSKDYKVKVIDFINYETENTYNPFKYLTSEIDICAFVDIIIKNTEVKDNKDPFFDSLTTSLLTTIILYMINFSKEHNFENLIKILNNLDTKKLNDILYKLAEKNIFYPKVLEQVEPMHLNIAIFDCKTKLKVFDQKQLLKITAKDNLEIDKFNEEKTILYIKVSSFENNFIIPTLIFQLYSVLFKKSEDKKDIKENIIVILDEFANIGIIPKISMFAAVSRRYKIHTLFIFQALAQIKQKYPNEWTDIMNNCDSILFLGGNDLETLTYVRTIIGVKSPREKNYLKTYISPVQYEELSKLPIEKCIVLIRGVEPICDDKYDPRKHENYKYIKE